MEFKTNAVWNRSEMIFLFCLLVISLKFFQSPKVRPTERLKWRVAPLVWWVAVWGSRQVLAAGAPLASKSQKWESAMNNEKLAFLQKLQHSRTL